MDTILMTNLITVLTVAVELLLAMVLFVDREYALEGVYLVLAAFFTGLAGAELSHSMSLHSNMLVTDLVVGVISTLIMVGMGWLFRENRKNMM